MPNHITNRLKINASKEQIEQILNFIKIEKEELEETQSQIGTIDFNKIFAMPKDVFSGDLGENERKLYGKNNWYDWSIKHWGTKWNAYNTPDGRNTEDTIYFTTAWSAVPKLISKLSELFQDVTFEYGFADEDFGCNVGEIKVKNAEILESYFPDSSSKEAYELAFDVTNSTPEDNYLVYSEEENNYIYNEDEEE